LEIFFSEENVGNVSYVLKVCKHLMGVGKKSTNIAVISELGRYSMYCYTKYFALLA
jgi:hypothetical protein